MPEARAAAQRSPGEHAETAGCRAGSLALACCHLPELTGGNSGWCKLSPSPEEAGPWGHFPSSRSVLNHPPPVLPTTKINQLSRVIFGFSIHSASAACPCRSSAFRGSEPTWKMSLAHFLHRLCWQGRMTTGLVNISKQMGQISCFSRLSMVCCSLEKDL